MTARPIRVLLVEDNELDARMVRRAMDAADRVYEVGVVTDGAAAIRELTGEHGPGGQGRPDLVLLDLNLPGLSGTEVLAAMKADPALRRIPVVVLTSSSAETDVIAAYDRHAAAFITKPVGAADYQAVVDSLERFWFETATLTGG